MIAADYIFKFDVSLPISSLILSRVKEGLELGRFAFTIRASALI
jgi:hypothetical protein